MAFGAKGAIASGFLQLTVSGGLIATYFAILFQDLPVLLSQALGLNLEDMGSPDAAAKDPSMVWLHRDRVRFAELLVSWCWMKWWHFRCHTDALTVVYRRSEW